LSHLDTPKYFIEKDYVT